MGRTATAPRPLYGLKHLKNASEAIILVEGEKCADALSSLGYTALSGWGGAKGIGKTDLKPLKNRTVIIWPYADEAGASYAKEAAIMLKSIGVTSVQIININTTTLQSACETAYRANEPTYEAANYLQGAHQEGTKPSIPKSWDAADAIIEENWGKVAVTALLKAVQPYEPNRLSNAKNLQNSANWPNPDLSILAPKAETPICPLETFPDFWIEWLGQQAACKGAPVDFIVAGLLSTASSLIGNAFWITPWAGWQEPPFIWSALVGSPSCGKSPALDAVFEPLAQIEKDLLPDYERCYMEYETKAEAAKAHLDNWRSAVKAAAKENQSPPPMPDTAIAPILPPRPRLRIMDATPEALCETLAGMPKGLLCQRDELAGWLGNMDRYNSGKGADRAMFLEAYRGRAYSVDRVKNGGKPLHIPHLGLAVLGGIQPDKLQSLLLKSDDDGLAARFLYYVPERQPPKRPEHPTDNNQGEMALRRLQRLIMAKDESGDPHPRNLPLTEEACTELEDFRQWAYNTEPEGGLLCSWYGKMPGFLLRLALVLTMLDYATDCHNEAPKHINATQIRAARRLLVNYFLPMAKKAFNTAALPPAQQDAAKLAAHIRNNCLEKINAREIERSQSAGIKSAKQFNAAIECLISANWVRLIKRQKGKAGRPQKSYEVSPGIYDKY